MVEHDEHVEPLKRNSYPLWIILFALSILLATIYSFTRLPRYMEASNSVKKGKEALARRDWNQAMDSYSLALEKIPSSKTARIGFAEAAFSNDVKEDDELGMYALEGVRLEGKEWKRMKTIIPERYLQFFK